MYKQIEGGQPTLAVIIPAYNAEKYIEQCILSVIMQPCKDLAVVVIDDGSTDRTPLIVKSFDKKDERIFVLCKKNGGVSSARNLGLDFCEKLNPKYIAFLDSDDVWVNGFYTEAMRTKIIEDDRDLYQFEYYDGNQKISRGRYRKAQKQKSDIPRFFLYFCSLIYRYSLIKTLRFNECIRVQEDESFKYIFACLCKSWEPVNCPIFIYRSNNGSVVHEKKFDVQKRYFEYVIFAWEWAEKQLASRREMYNSITEKDIAQCKTMQKTFLAEYIEVACRQGVPVSMIVESIDKSGLGWLFEDKTVWCDAKRIDIWERFANHPYTTWLFYRLQQIIFDCIYILRSNPLLQRIKYPEKL